MNYHPSDLLLQRQVPLVPVPLHGEFVPLAESGHRFLGAGNGLFLEVRRPWLHLIWPVALQDKVTMPYGRLEKTVMLAFGAIPRELVNVFLEDARRALPNECAAWVVYNERTGLLEYVYPEIERASIASVRYNRPSLEPWRHLAIDLHSHGMLPAGFSLTDDQDDRGEFKIAGVVGNCDREHFSVRFRLCAGGLFIDVPFPSRVTEGNDLEEVW